MEYNNEEILNKDDLVKYNNNNNKKIDLPW
jgi:hypothetical protein